MSWAAHDPEGYDEVMREATAEGLGSAWAQHFGESAPAGFIPDLVDFIQTQAPKAFEALFNEWGMKHEGAATHDYLMQKHGQ
jgi:hypothetical protein